MIARGETLTCLQEVTKFLYQVKCNEEFSEYELDTVFVCRYDREVHPNPDEVSATKWIDLQELLNQDPLAPWVKIMGERGILRSVGEYYGN